MSFSNFRPLTSRINPSRRSRSARRSLRRNPRRSARVGKRYWRSARGRADLALERSFLRSNPRRGRKAHRRNPAKSRGRRIYPTLFKRSGKIFLARGRKYKRPFKVNPRRKGRKSYRRNPGASMKLKGILKGATNKKFLMATGGGVGGFVAGGMLTTHLRNKGLYLSSAPDWATKSIGAVNLVLGAALAMKGKKALLKSAGGGMALAGGYDLAQNWVPSLNLPALSIGVPALPGMSGTQLGSPVYPTGFYPTVADRMPVAGMELAGMDDEDRSPI